jgi:alginate O-acetyltransferase complex protein AlgI
LFYAWGQAGNLPVILLVLVFNYWLGPRVRANNGRRWLYTGVIINVALLAFYKLLTTFGLGMIPFSESILPQSVAGWLSSLTFPLGLSFISFQVISYLVDVHKGTVPAEGSLVTFASYVLLFPKLLVGPIVRYRSLAGQLGAPVMTAPEIATGIRRFIAGLAKKVLIADVLGGVANAVFKLAPENIPATAAWIALIAFALQIYFDFSGLSDMAIGLGKMMGLTFLENFNYPYIATSIGDFWRRWHISLSTWFRDYVFFPLERRRIPVVGQPLNVIIVFLLTGLWHGVTSTFIAWGLLHGLCIAMEGLFLNRLLQKTGPIVRHVYVLSVLLLSWLVFRAPSLSYAFEFLKRLAGAGASFKALPFTETSPLPFLEPSFLLALGLGVMLAMPVQRWIEGLAQRIAHKYPWTGLPLTAAGDLVLLMMLVLSAGAMAASKFLPGIYERF